MKTIGGIIFDEVKVHDLLFNDKTLSSEFTLLTSSPDFEKAIEENNFEQVFKMWEKRGKIKCLLVALLLEAEIPFLDYMKKTPYNLFGCNVDRQVFISSIKLPDNIKEINVLVACSSDRFFRELQSIILPKKFKLVEDAIENYLIGDTGFGNEVPRKKFMHSGKIFYPGTISELEKQLPEPSKEKNDSWLVIKCSDGEYTLKY